MGIPPSFAVYNFSYAEVYKRPEDGSQLEPKHVAVNKLITRSAVCDRFIIYILFHL